MIKGASRAVYHKVYVLNNVLKQRFEAHSFEGLCKTGIISWPGGPWLPTRSILDTLGPEKMVLMRVTLWKTGLFIINRADNKRLYILLSINIFSFGFKNCRIWLWFLNILYLALFTYKMYSGLHHEEPNIVLLDDDIIHNEYSIQA